jgi:hypothetical protein
MKTSVRIICVVTLLTAVGCPKHKHDEYQHKTVETVTEGRTSTMPVFERCGDLEGMSLPYDGRIYISTDIDSCWDSEENIKLDVYFTNEDGDELLMAETVIFDFTYTVTDEPVLYQCIELPFECRIPAILTTVSTTYFNERNKDNCVLTSVRMTLDKDDANNPYRHRQSITGYLSLKHDSTYSGDIVIGRMVFVVKWKSSKLCELDKERVGE